MTSSDRYDVLVIGAGVAGVAIAERLARSASERSRRLRVLVVDEMPCVGAGASRGLQGWFHSGALYARLEDQKSYQNCQTSMSLLRDHYRPTVPWFGDHIEFLLDRNHDPVWQRVTERVIGVASGEVSCINTDPYLRVPTHDRAMYTDAVMRDLSASAARLGVEFALSTTATSNGEGETLLTSSDGRERRVDSGVSIHTVGHRCASFDSGFVVRSGVIVSVFPVLEAPSLVRIAMTPGDNISHIRQRTQSGKLFSAMGDSTALPIEPTHEEARSAAEQLIAKSVGFFGPGSLTNRSIAWHVSQKIDLAVGGADGHLFEPRVFEMGPRRLAVIPSKFSLFPLTAEMMHTRLTSDGLFSDLRPGISLARPAPPVAPMLASELHGLECTDAADERHRGRFDAPSVGKIAPASSVLASASVQH